MKGVYRGYSEGYSFLNFLSRKKVPKGKSDAANAIVAFITFHLYFTHTFSRSRQNATNKTP